MKNSTTTHSSQNSLSDIPTGELLKTFRARRKANPHKHYVPNGKVEEFITLVGANETFISLFSATLWWEAIEPHPRNPYAVLWVAVDAKGRRFVVDELYTADYFNGAWKPCRLTNAALAQRIKFKSEGFRIEKRIGAPLLFTTFQTVFAALYDDRLSVEFEGNEEDDTDTAENLTDLAEHDYRIMQKDEADYEWIWDACFFGRGLLLLNEFDRTPGIMAPDPKYLRSGRGTGAIRRMNSIQAVG